MSDAICAEAPLVPTEDAPMPGWGREVSSTYGAASLMQRQADEISHTLPHHLVIFFFKPYAGRESRLGGTRLRTASAASGACEILPAGADYWGRWKEEKEVAVFYLSQGWLDRLAQDDYDLPSANVFADALPIVDTRISLIGQMLREEMSSDGPEMQDLEVDSMLNLLGIHLLRQYGVARPQKDLGGLSDRQLGQVRDFMAANLRDGVRLDEMAGVVGLSSSQLLRSFRKRTGTSPHQYLTRLRLDQARSLIMGEPLPLAEIARVCGFSSQSHLTSIMRKQDGLTPGALRPERV